MGQANSIGDAGAACGSGSGGDTITSPNSTLSVGGTSTATTLDINLAHANTFTANQSAPAFIGTGTTAGFIDFPEGSTSSAVSPCNTATSVCIQAPTAVTSYVMTLPGAQPTSGNTYLSCTAANPSVCSWVAGSGGSTFQVNGTGLASSTTINFENGSATDGLTLSFSNPSAGNIQLGMSGILTGAGGGTGVNNTATLTLGTSNQNWATLGTGIVKNTTTTGALTDAASSDVIALWTGTCSSSTYLNGAGACATPSGSGTVTAEPQYDVTYYTQPGTTAQVGGAAISGFQYDSTTGAPAAATATNLGALADLAQYDIVSSGGTAAALVGTAISGFVYASTSGNPAAATAANLGSLVDIASNAVIKSGGTTSAMTASSMTDNGTTVTSTDTGGYVAPVFVANGTTAGFADFPEGSTSAAVAPCNTATSVCIQAPATVTSYLVDLPPAAANGVVTNTNTSSVVTQGFSGDANHSATVTISSGTSVSSTSLCSTTICPAGTYEVNAD